MARCSLYQGRDYVTVNLGGSGAIDNLSAAVPEPSAALVFAIGAVVVGAGVRREG